MLTFMLSVLLNTPVADACGNSMRTEERPTVQVRVSFQTDDFAEDSAEMRALKRRISGFEYCHHHQVRNAPDTPAVTLSTSLTIAPSGDVHAVDMDEVPELTQLTSCVQSKMSQVRFPPAETERSVQLDLTLSHQFLSN